MTWYDITGLFYHFMRFVFLWALFSAQNGFPEAAVRGREGPV